MPIHNKKGSIEISVLIKTKKNGGNIHLHL